jgi:hypothetical protein
MKKKKCGIIAGVTAKLYRAGETWIGNSYVKVLERDGDQVVLDSTVLMFFTLFRVALILRLCNIYQANGTSIETNFLGTLSSSYCSSLCFVSP